MNIKTRKLIKKTSKWCTEEGEEINLCPANEHLRDGVYFVNTIKLADGSGRDYVLRLVYSDENFK